MTTANTAKMTDDMLSVPFIVEGMRMKTPLYEVRGREAEYTASASSPFCFSVEKRSAKKRKSLTFDMEKGTITDEDGNAAGEKDVIGFFRELDTNLYVGEPSCVKYIISGQANIRTLCQTATGRWTPLQAALLRNRDFGISINGSDAVNSRDMCMAKDVPQEDLDAVIPIIAEVTGGTADNIKAEIITGGETGFGALMLNMDAAVYIYNHFCGKSAKDFKRFLLIWSGGDRKSFPTMASLAAFRNSGELLYGKGREDSLFDYLDGRCAYADRFPIVTRFGGNPIIAAGGVKRLTEYIAKGYESQNRPSGAVLWNGVEKRNDACSYEDFFHEWTVLLYWKSQFAQGQFDMYPANIAKEISDFLEIINTKVDEKVFASILERVQKDRESGTKRYFSLPVSAEHLYSHSLSGYTVTNDITADELRSIAGDSGYMYESGLRGLLWKPFAVKDVKKGNDFNVVSVCDDYDRLIHGDAELVALKAGDGTIVALAIVTIDMPASKVTARVETVIRNGWFNGSAGAAIKDAIRDSFGDGR